MTALINQNIQSSFIISLCFALMSGFQTEYILTALYLFLFFLSFARSMMVLLFFFFCAILNILNADVFSIPVMKVEPVLQMLVCFFCIFRLYLSNKINVNKFIAITFMFFAFYLLVHSLFISKMPMLSLLKSASFIFIASSIYLSFESLEIKETQDFLGIFFWVLLFLIIISFLGFILGFGYEVNGTGFQGALNHPQTMGMFSGAVFIFCLYLLSLNKEFHGNSLIIFLAFLALILVFASESRTGLLMILLPCSMAIIYYSKLLFNSFAFFMTSIFFLLTAVLLINFYMDEFIAYLVKGSGSDNFADIAMSSRGPLFLAMWNNIVLNPILGIGFGVPTDNIFFNIEDASSFAGIIVSYPNEKGILFFAILEEVGLIGLMLFIMLLALSLHQAFKRNILGAMLGMSIISSNITEATFVSFGGAGLILFIFFSVGVMSLRKN